MPRKKSAIPSAAVVLKAIAAFEKATGKNVVQVKFHPDGSFRLMTSDHIAKNKEPDGNPALAGWDDVVPNGQA
ncbi:MAG: hypothetical protein JSS54_10950 [Proteobacteria bacterium]|nr:hypothetical protein [Pseudomonadota bacterium]